MGHAVLIKGLRAAHYSCVRDTASPLFFFFIVSCKKTQNERIPIHSPLSGLQMCYLHLLTVPVAFAQDSFSLSGEILYHFLCQAVVSSHP